jgi:hypothetical protein
MNTLIFGNGFTKSIGGVSGLLDLDLIVLVVIIGAN